MPNNYYELKDLYDELSSSIGDSLTLSLEDFFDGDIRVLPSNNNYFDTITVNGKEVPCGWTWGVEVDLIGDESSIKGLITIDFDSDSNNSFYWGACLSDVSIKKDDHFEIKYSTSAGTTSDVPYFCIKKTNSISNEAAKTKFLMDMLPESLNSLIENTFKAIGPIYIG